MSKARLVITAVILEGRSAAEVAAEYGVSKSWLYELLARYRSEGEAAFQARSRKPRTSPRALSAGTVALIVGLRQELTAAGLDAGPATIGWHLQHHHQLTVSVSTIARTLSRQGLVEPQPKKRPKSSYIRFEAAMPNECWQSDFTHYPLLDGSDVEILTWLDDHARYVLHCSAHQPVTGKIVLNTFRQACAQHGIPASTLTDNGMVYTVRFATGPGGKTALEAELRRLNITQKNSAAKHPTTCGKVERFQQTLKKWLFAQPLQPNTLGQLQELLDAFVHIYNHQRGHDSLARRSTPATAYQARPKATPTADRSTDTHDRIRHDKIDSNGKLTLRVNGRLHHIGVGRTLARTPVILLVQDLHVRVVHASTGELLRELQIDPNRDYQPTGKTRYPTRKAKKTEPWGFGQSGIS